MYQTSLTRPLCLVLVSPSRPMQNVRHFADDISTCITSNKGDRKVIRISIKFIPKVKRVVIASNKGLVPRGQQAITRSNDDLIPWRMYIGVTWAKWANNAISFPGYHTCWPMGSMVHFKSKSMADHRIIYIYIYIYIRRNERCCPRTINISNVNFFSKISTPPAPVFKNMGQQISGPGSSND